MRIRLNTIFYFILAADLLLYLCLFKGASKYLDSNSIIYYGLFTLCILGTVIINGRRKNVFMEMLIAVIIAFYHMRIPILLFPDVPTLIDRISVSSGLINKKILELCYHYLALSIAIIILNPKINRMNCYVDKRKTNKILLFVSAIILFHIVSIECLSVGYGGRAEFMGIFRIIPSILTPFMAILVVVVYIVFVGKNLTKGKKYWAMAIIITRTGYACYYGNKASVVLLILYFLIAKMICYGPIILSGRGVAISIILVPLSIVSYFIGNTMRFYQRGMIEIDGVIDKVRMIGSSFSDIMHSFSYRIGFFDFYVEASENSLYPPYISYKYYFTSIIDKMTPGFDVFGVTYASKMFWPARNGTMYASSNAEQVTLFGEASVIFSFFSIIMFFIMIMFFRFLIKRRPATDPFINVFYVAIIFNAYSNWLHGFGFDMFFCIDLVYSIIFFFCMAWFCRISLHKRKRLLTKQLC